MAIKREDLALVAEFSAQLVAGGTKLDSANKRCNLGSAIVFSKMTRQSKYGLRGVRVGEASTPFSMLACCHEVFVGGLPGEPQRKEDACRLATLPMRMGGLGLRSATLMAPAAYWTSVGTLCTWVQERLPAMAQLIVLQLEAALELVGCLSDLRAAGDTLDKHGFVGRPHRRACVHLLSLLSNPMSLPTAGNIMHLPFLNTFTGRSL